MTALRTSRWLAAIPLLLVAAPSAGEAVQVTVSWPDDSARPLALAIGDQAPEPAPSGRSWTKRVEIPASSHRRVVPLRIAYGERPMRTPVRLLPDESRKTLHLNSRRVECRKPVAQDLGRALDLHRGDHVEVLGIALTSARALGDICRGASASTQRAFGTVLVRALNIYPSLDGSVDIMALAGFLSGSGLDLATANLRRRAGATFVNSSARSVKELLAARADRSELAQALGNLIVLSNESELRDEFARQIDITDYEAHLIQIEFERSSEELRKPAGADTAALAQRVGRLGVLARAAEGTRGAVAFAKSKVDPESVRTMERLIASPHSPESDPVTEPTEPKGGRESIGVDRSDAGHHTGSPAIGSQAESPAAAMDEIIAEAIRREGD